MNIIKPSLICPKPAYIYAAQFVRSKDGDTVVLMVDQGFDNYISMTTRLYGINTPETHGVAKTSAEYIAGKAAEEFVNLWMEEAKRQVVIESYNGKKLQTEKFGRWLSVIYRENDLVSLNEVLLAKRLAQPVNY
jgi:endonuclease YncB( thermonuclease family)